MNRRILDSRRLAAGLLAVGLAVSSAWSVSWWGKRDNREGLVAMVRNRAVLFPKEGVAKPVELNDAFQIDDRIKTREDSAVRILFMEDSFLNVGADTTYVLTKSRYDDVTGARDVGFCLAAGKVRLAVGRLFGRGSASVDTPTAVVGVKGTDVIIDHDERLRRTRILVLQGEVEVQSKNPALAGQVTTVSGGNHTDVGEGSAAPVVQETPPSVLDAAVAGTDVLPDPERSAPDTTIADATQPPQPPPGSGVTAADPVVTEIVRTTGSIGGGTSDPGAVQNGGGGGTGLDSPLPDLLPPPITTVPPDQCPGCPP